ncbi:RagB/SusD family nutrient uptake outer membrane protein [Wocania ichthyoenteri]|uniref:RagB/SusD family nutrient uptake outer membrane protein n=1 Tax=Wocania ichthyoenteri TaxID=1230531 RepID=UPI0009DE6E07|nr:RagB/SusD family nutrient uptake outer membrane protein [Wocania ichthyoenteri]
MKKIFYILLIAIGAFMSCENDLVKEPDFLSETSIFESKEITEAYFANVYNDMPFMDRSGQSQNGLGTISAVGMEYTAFAVWQNPNNAVRRNYSQENGAGGLTYWPYANIRDVNYILENIVNSQSFDQNYIDSKVAEAKFLRAFMYFEMVKRYGGVPLVTKVLDKDAPNEEMYPPRNTEKEVYDFIYSELNEAIALFSDNKTGANGRADKHAALALQSRAMLYAASISRFGQVQLNGAVGIPSSDAQGFYQKSYDASEALMSAGFSLYNKSSDKVKNYGDLFLDEGNSEIIFAEKFEAVTRGHDLDLLAIPQGYDSPWNSNFQVFYDFIENFEYVDGSPNIPRSQLTTANTWDMDEFFGKKDPRFRASVFYPETVYRDKPVYFHHKTTYTEGGVVKTSTNANEIIDYNGKLWQGAAFPRNIRTTSLLLRKKLDPTLIAPKNGGNESGQDYYIFRYGEILLNHAEAAFYLNKPDEALTNINLIRDRAGMPARTVATEENIRLERQFELCFEDHRFWDLIRWRTATTVMDGVRTQGLRFEYNLDTDRYTITLRNASFAEPNVRTFGPERYYLPFGQVYISDNPNLVQNPGY